MKHSYYITDMQKALPLLGMKMLRSSRFNKETLEDGTQTYGVLEFDGELSAKCIEFCEIIEKEVE